MIGLVVALLLGVALATIVRFGDRKQGPAMLTVIMVGYVIRLIVQIFIRDFQFFSHEPFGDSWGYEAGGVEIARLWRIIGVQFMTTENMPSMLGSAILPQNLFAAVVYLNSGEPTRLGCTAVIAFAAGLTCFNIYHMALDFGADPTIARRTVSLFYFGPTFLHYTSDTFKDGLVACFTVGALASALRLSRRFSLVHVAVGLLSLWGLWYVRFYLIFVTMAPLVVGLLGAKSKSIARPLFGSLALISVAIVLLALTDTGQEVVSRAANTYASGTSEMVLNANAKDGSGVTFDDGGNPLGAIWLKLAYTLFAPFPWANGSFGFHVGKIDVALIAFFLFRTWKVVQLKANRQTAIMVMTYAIPCTLMYATSMANVGLIARQRLVVVTGLVFLACLYRPELERVANEEEDAESPLRLAPG